MYINGGKAFEKKKNTRGINDKSYLPVGKANMLWSKKKNIQKALFSLSFEYTVYIYTGIK